MDTLDDLLVARIGGMLDDPRDRCALRETARFLRAALHGVERHVIRWQATCALASPKSLAHRIRAARAAMPRLTHLSVDASITFWCEGDPLSEEDAEAVAEASRNVPHLSVSVGDPMSAARILRAGGGEGAAGGKRGAQSLHVYLSVAYDDGLLTDRHVAAARELEAALKDDAGAAVTTWAFSVTVDCQNWAPVFAGIVAMARAGVRIVYWSYPGVALNAVQVPDAVEVTLELRVNPRRTPLFFEMMRRADRISLMFRVEEGDGMPLVSVRELRGRRSLSLGYGLTARRRGMTATILHMLVAKVRELYVSVHADRFDPIDFWCVRDLVLETLPQHRDRAIVFVAPWGDAASLLVARLCASHVPGSKAAAAWGWDGGWDGERIDGDQDGTHFAAVFREHPGLMQRWAPLI